MRVNDRRALLAKLLDDMYARIDDAVARDIILKNWGEADGKHVLVSKLAEVTNIRYGFTKSSIIDASWLEYFPNVTNAEFTFYNCFNLIEAGSSQWKPRLQSTKSMFSGCKSLKSVQGFEAWPITSIGQYMFWNCSNITLTTLPIGVTSIGASAFQRCTKCIWKSNALQNVTNIDGTSPQYGGGAFQYNTFEDRYIVLGEGITHIGMLAFNEAAIDKIRILAATPPTLDDVYTNPYHTFINNKRQKMQVYVPDASLDAYKKAANWEDVATNWNNIHPMSEWKD